MRGRPVTGKERAEMRALYEEGLSSNQIGERLGRSGRLVRTHLKNVGALRTRAEAVTLARQQGRLRRVPLNEDFFEGALTASAAWVLGLLYGDGHLQEIEGVSYQVLLAGSEQVVRAASDLVGFGGKVSKMRDVSCWRAAWSSKRMLYSLKSLGMESGSKASSMLFPSLSTSCLPHFVRGLWDSDGSWCVRGKSVRAVYLTASSAFAGGLSRVLSRAGIRPSVREVCTRYRYKGAVRDAEAFRFDLVVSETRKLAGWLYADSTMGTRCARKYEQASVCYRG